MKESVHGKHRRLRWLVMALGLGVGFGLWSQTITSTAKTTTRTSSSKNAETKGETSGKDLGRIEEKLDQILANQQTILGKFDEVMNELHVVKIRATVKH